MNEYIEIVNNIEPNRNYKCNTESFINLIEEINRDTRAITIYTEGSITVRGYEIDFDKIYQKTTAALKGMYDDFFRRVKELYIKAISKIGAFISKKGLNTVGANIKYSWTKLDFGKLRSYIDDFGTGRNLNTLKGYLNTTNDDDVDYEEKMDTNTYLDIMSSNNYKGIFGDDVDSYKELKYRFTSKQETITVNKFELANMYKNDILDCMKSLYKRIMTVQADLNKWIDDEIVPEHEYREKQKEEMLRARKNLGEVYGNNRGSTKTKLERARKAARISTSGNSIFMDLMFKLIIYGFNQQIIATINAIKSTKFNKENIKQQILIPAPRI